MKGKIKNDISGDKVFDNWSLLDDIKDRYIKKESYIEEMREYIDGFNDEYYCEDIQRYKDNKKISCDYRVWEEGERLSKIKDELY